MAQYRKKPVVIEAFKWTGGPDQTEDPEWICEALRRNPNAIGSAVIYRDPLYMGIKTLEGMMRATPGDWIIKGIKDEIYPCKPDIFALTYEQADAHQNQEARQ